MKKIYILSLLIVAMMMCGSCTRKIYIPLEQTRQSTDTLYRALWRTDTVVDRDTVQTFVKGDSVVTERIRWRYRVREKHDTVREVRRDSVCVREPYPVEVVREVAQPLRWWQKTLMVLGILMCTGMCTALYLKIRERRG